jgi:hypothetical protein
MGIFCTFPLSVATLVIRFNPFGAKCSYNTSEVDYSKGGGFDAVLPNTYADDAEKLVGLAATELILAVCQCTFCLYPLLATPVRNFESHKKPIKVKEVKKVDPPKVQQKVEQNRAELKKTA